MKTLLILVTFTLFVIQSGLSQQSKKFSYLVVHINSKADKNVVFYTIDAESGNRFASEIYNLVPFRAGKYATDQPAFYQVRNDTSTVFYNCFVNTTEALSFLSDYKWELISVAQETKTSFQMYDGQSVSDVISTPVYYFRKLIE